MIDRRLFLMGSSLLMAACATATMPAGAFASDRIDVVTRGAGSDVVMIHGLSSSRDIWNDTVAAVPGYRYHFIQINGFAGSAAAGNGGQGPLLAPVAGEIARYIREAGLDRPAIVGHSMGGSLAMMVAARHPRLVSRLMVVDMLPFMGAMFGPPGATPASVEPVAAQIRDRMKVAEGAALRTAIEGTIATMVKTPALRAGPIQHGVASDQRVSARGMYDLITTDLGPELRAIRVPTTILYVCAPNAPVDEAQMDRFYRAAYAPIEGATLRRIPDSWHFIMLDQPEVFRAELRAFLGNPSA